MAELTLEKELRLSLRAQAHGLDPVVLLGAAGLTDAVVAEVDRALTAHSLIKVRVPVDDRSEREAIFATIADRVGAARVQVIGKLIVLYRPPPLEDGSETQQKPEKTRGEPARSKRHR
jgi:putative YhbY family RNA-binding protein